MWRVWFLVAVALLTAGCGSSGPVLPVNGIVTMDDSPLDAAAVTFLPDEKAPGTGGSARTGSDGKFVVLGAKGQNGLVPGTYKVTVSKLRGGAAVTDEPSLVAPSEDELKADLPAIYSNPAQTILSYSITGDGKPIEIKLKSKGK